jgi:hypothetical protein
MGLVIAAGVVVLAMVGMSLWGAKVLPSGALIPLHLGVGGYGNWRPKVISLVAYPAIGLLVTGIAVATRSSGSTDKPVIVPFALVILAFAQYKAISVAISRSRLG